MQIDLTGQNVEISEKLSLTNTGREHLKSFLYCLPKQHAERLSYLSVRNRQSSSCKKYGTTQCIFIATYEIRR